MCTKCDNYTEYNRMANVCGYNFCPYCGAKLEKRTNRDYLRTLTNNGLAELLIGYDPGHDEWNFCGDTYITRESALEAAANWLGAARVEVAE